MLSQHLQSMHRIGVRAIDNAITVSDDTKVKASGTIDIKKCDVFKMVSADAFNLTTREVVKVGTFNLKGKPWSALRVVRDQSKLNVNTAARECKN